MKKISVLLGLLVLAGAVFASSDEYASVKDVQRKVAAAQKYTQQQDSFTHTGATFLQIIGAYEELYLVNAEQAISLNEVIKQAIFTNAKGETVLITSGPVKYAVAYAVEHGSSYAYTDKLGYFDEENVVDNFYRHLQEPYCPGKSQFEALALDMVQQNQYQVLSQHIYQNLAAPFAELTDEEAAPLAKCYSTYEVGHKSLLDYARSGRGGIPNSIGEEMEDFANRVEALAK